MRKIIKAALGFVVIIVVAVIIMYFQPARIEDISPDTFVDITKVKVSQLNGLLIKEYEVTNVGDVSVISKYLAEILARKLPQMFAPKEHQTKLGESYVIELFHGIKDVSIISLNPGYVKLDDITYSVHAPRSFTLLQAILENQ